MEGLLKMVFEQLLCHLYNTDTRGDGLAREMSLIDEAIGMKTEVIAEVAIVRLAAKEGVKAILQGHWVVV
jgi:hypothetical protein